MSSPSSLLHPIYGPDRPLDWSATIERRGRALAFATGVGAYGWVVVVFVISAELGGARRAGLLTGMAFASIVVGLLIGPAVFELLLDHWDSYAVPWVVFAALATLITAATLLAGPAIDRERR